METQVAKDSISASSLLISDVIGGLYCFIEVHLPSNVLSRYAIITESSGSKMPARVIESQNGGVEKTNQHQTQRYPRYLNGAVCLLHPSLPPIATTAPSNVIAMGWRRKKGIGPVSVKEVV